MLFPKGARVVVASLAITRSEDGNCAASIPPFKSSMFFCSAKVSASFLVSKKLRERFPSSFTLTTNFSRGRRLSRYGRTLCFLIHSCCHLLPLLARYSALSRVLLRNPAVNSKQRLRFHSPS